MLIESPWMFNLDSMHLQIELENPIKVNEINICKECPLDLESKRFSI